MPKEDRRIIFSQDEVYKAIYALSTQKQVKKPPPGVVTYVDEKKGDASMLEVTLENPTVETTEKVEYTRDFMAAALMLFCRGSGIPLPKSARKSVLLVDGRVVLRAQI